MLPLVSISLDQPFRLTATPLAVWTESSWVYQAISVLGVHRGSPNRQAIAIAVTPPSGDCPGHDGGVIASWQDERWLHVASAKRGALL